MKTNGLSNLSKHADFVALDILSLVAAFAVAYFLKFGDFSFIESPTWRALLIFLALTDIVATLLTSPYSGIFRRRYWDDIKIQLGLALEMFLATCVVFYLFKIGVAFSREMLLVTYGAYVCIALVLKFLHKRHLLSRWSNRPADSVKRAVLVTSASLAKHLEEMTRADDMKASRIVGFCLTDGHKTSEFLGRPASAPSSIVSLCAETNADDVIVAVTPSLLGSDILEELMTEGLTVRIGLQQSLGVSSETQEIGQVGIIKTLDLRRHTFGNAQAIYLPTKRLFDLILGLAGCAIALPIAGVTKIAYLASGDVHPILYRQTRIGLRGRPFSLWKLRTMVWDADKQLKILLQDENKREEWQRNQKLTNDPRITPIGRFLRKTSLDELPQFVNVVTGDMSIIGPRPLIPGELEEHGGRPLYNKVKPGITGWWACNGRSDIEYDERLELEYYYVTHCSLYLDAICILRTAVAVFKREGAQ